MLTRFLGQLRGSARVEHAHAPTAPAGLEPVEPRLLLSSGILLSSLVKPPGIEKPILSVSLVDSDSTADESGYDAAFRITRAEGSFGNSGDLAFTFSFSGSAAKSDYLVYANKEPLTKTTAVIPDGDSFIDLVIRPVDDASPEPTESLTLTLKSGKTYTLDYIAKSATINILDNEPTVSVRAFDDVAVETSSYEKPNTAHFRVTRDASDLSAPLTVGITLSGSATPGTSPSKPGDYLIYYLDDSIVNTKNIVIPAGQAFVDFYVVPTDDSKVEKTETVTLSLKNNPKVYTVDKLQAKTSVTINDLAIPFVGVKISRIIASEKNPSQPANQARFNFTREGGDLSLAVTVYFHVSGEAAPGQDYTLRNSAGDPITLDPDFIGSVTFAPGQKTTTVDVVAIDDIESEDARESVVLTLLSEYSHPFTYALTAKTADQTATAFVTDYEVAPEDIDGQIITISTRSGAATLMMGENHSVFFTVEKNMVWGGKHYTYTKTSSNTATLVADVYGESNPASLTLTFNSTSAGSFTGTDADGELLAGSFKATTPKGAYAYTDITGGTFTGKITSSSDPDEVNSLLVAEFDAHTLNIYLNSVLVDTSSYTYERIAPNFGFIRSGGDDDPTWSLIYFTLPSKANIYTFTPEDPEYPWQVILNGTFDITI